MAIKEYSIKAPDGSVIKFRAPDDAPREKILAFAKKQFEASGQNSDTNQNVSADSGAQDMEYTPKFNIQRYEELLRVSPQTAIAYAQQQTVADSAEKSEVERKKRLNEIAKTNPYQAELIRNLSPMQGAAIGYGGAFKELAAGFGLTDISPEEREIFGNLKDTSRAATIGNVVGQAAPFAAGGIGGAMLTKGAPLAAQAGIQGLIGATEGNVIARGTGGTGEDILAATALGGVIGGGAEVLGPVVNRAARALVQKIKGKPPIGILIDDTGKPTKELQSALDKSGQTFDEMVQGAQQGTESVESIVGAGRSGNQAKAVQDVSESINLDRLGAAERLGMEDAPLGVVSDDAATQELAGILSAVPGSRASVALNEFTDEFGRRADRYVEELGGSIDRGMIDQDLMVNMQSDISRIKALENRLYDRIRSDIGEETMVNAKPLKNLISARARTLGGVKNLSKVEKDVLDRIDSGKLSYASLDDVISDVGAALSRETDTYSTVQRAKLAEMYSNLSKMREGVAETFGHKVDLQRAKKIGAARFGLQESTQSLFGKDLERSIFPRIDKTVKGLEKGSVREFRATMELIPEKFRKPVAATMLNTALTGGRNQALGVNSGEFSKWYKNLSRNESAMNELKKYIGDDAMTRLDDIANLAQGVANVTRNKKGTGVTTEALKRLDDIDGVVGKIYGAAKRYQGVPVAGRAAAVIGNTAKTLVMDKTPAAQAAQDLMGSKKFVDAVKEAARAGTNDRKFRRLNSQLKSTTEYKKYLQSVNDNAAEQIAATGLIAWLASDNEEQK
jgi:hypothetical protein